MSIYENFMLKQYGEYINARICCKIATVLNERHKSDKCKPDYIISKGIEFTTKSKVCLERFDKALWNEIAIIATEEFRLLTDDEVTVKLLGGELIIRWDRESNLVYMTGPAKVVFDGIIEV